MLSSLSEWVTDVIDRLGYVGVALLIALENLFPPIPSEIVLPFAGFVASDGDANLIGMIVAATIGSLVGAWILYGIAACDRTRRFARVFIVRYGKWLRLTNADIDKAERWFDRRAVVAVLVGRCIPLIRSLVSIPAGFRRMPFATFTLYTAIGSAIWNTALIGAGYAAARQLGGRRAGARCRAVHRARLDRRRHRVVVLVAPPERTRARRQLKPGRACSPHACSGHVRPVERGGSSHERWTTVTRCVGTQSAAATEPHRVVLVVGQGYVGLPLAMRAVEVGDDVIGSTSTRRRSSHCGVAGRTWRTSPTSTSSGAGHGPLPPGRRRRTTSASSTSP